MTARTATQLARLCRVQSQIERAAALDLSSAQGALAVVDARTLELMAHLEGTAANAHGLGAIYATRLGGLAAQRGEAEARLETARQMANQQRLRLDAMERRLRVAAQAERRHREGRDVEAIVGMAVLSRLASLR